MSKTTLTLSEPVAKALKVYTAQTKSGMNVQSQVVEEALREFFERHDVKNRRKTPFSQGDRRSKDILKINFL